jgi:hypothetical protein
MTERALKLLRIHATDAKEPMDPIENAEPMDPMLIKELTEPMLSMELTEQTLNMEFLDVMDRDELLVRTVTRV